MRAMLVIVAAAALAAAAPAHADHFGPPPVGFAPGSLALLPATPRLTGNCIPFGQNFDYRFTGFLYRNVPAFHMRRGDRIRFDLGRVSSNVVRRNIYFSRTNVNPQIPFGRLTPSFVKALGWTQVVSDAQIPENPRGNTIIDDYELTFTAEHDFEFPGGGLAVGFAGYPDVGVVDAGCEQDQVAVTATAYDASRHFYARFYGKPHLWDGTLDNFPPYYYGVPGGADTGEMMGMVIEPLRTYEVLVRSFISGNHLVGPPWDTCKRDLLEDEKGAKGEKKKQQLWYKGDDRSFDFASKSYRTSQGVTVAPDETFDSDGLVGDTLHNRTGVTKGFAEDALANGALDAADEDVLDDCHLLHKTGSALTDRMRVTVTRTGPEAVRVRFVGSAQDPLVPLYEWVQQRFDRPGTVDWDVALTIDVNENRWRLLGWHDDFPAFEIFVNGQLVYGVDPGMPPVWMNETLQFMWLATQLVTESRVEIAGDLQ